MNQFLYERDQKDSLHCRISNQCVSTYKPSTSLVTKNNTHVRDPSIDNIKHCCTLRRYALKPLISRASLNCGFDNDAWIIGITYRHVVQGE